MSSSFGSLNNSTAQTATPQAVGQVSFHAGSISSLSPISSTTGGEVYQSAMEVFKEIAKTSVAGRTVSIIGLSREVISSLHYSIVLVTVQEGKQPAIGYHTLIMEGTGARLDPRVQTFDGVGQIQIDLYPSDAFDNELKQQIASQMSKSFPNCEHLDSGFTVVNRDVVLNNQEGKLKAQQIIHSASTAATIELFKKNKGNDLSIPHLANDGIITVDTRFQQAPVHDALGIPYRADFIVGLSSKSRNSQEKNTRNINNGSTVRHLAQSAGFVNLLWVGKPASNNNYMFNQAQPTQCFVPEIVLTMVETHMDQTPASVAFSLWANYSLYNQNNWINCFRPNDIPPGKLDLNDVGAINIEGNLPVPGQTPTAYGEPLPTKDRSTTMAVIGNFLQHLVHPTPVFSIDCPIGAANSYYLDVYAAAACGNRAAEQQVMDAWNTLTGGRFSRKLPAGTSLFARSPQRIHRGVWINSNGEKRPSGELDRYVAVANFVAATKAEPGRIAQWSDTYTREDINSDIRMANRKKILSLMSNDSLEVIGESLRVTFNTEVIRCFAEAMAEAFQASSIIVQTTSNSQAGDFQNQRGVAQWALTGNNINMSGVPFAQGGSSGPTGFAFGNTWFNGGRFA
jgi:hypothetical protein